MKITLLLILAAIILNSGCAGPAARHEARVDRRYDRRDRATTDYNAPYERRYDRRTDRAERVERRYNYDY